MTINHTEVEQRVSNLRVPDLVLSDLSSDSNLKSASKNDELLLNQNPFDIADSRLDELELGGDLLSKEDTDLLALSTQKTSENPIKEVDCGKTGDTNQTDEESVYDQIETQKGDKVGTPFYLAPELWKCEWVKGPNQPCSKMSDIWALGVILYETCCFHFPWPAENIEELEKKILNEPYKKIPQTVSQDLRDLIKKMLRKDQSKRPTIEEIIYSKSF